jgi:hypothetical protein
LYPVLLTEANVYNPGTNQSDSIRWGIFKGGVKKAYQRFFSSRQTIGNVINQDPIAAPGTVVKEKDTDQDRRIIRKMRVKTAITWGILAVLLVIVVVKTFKKK